MADWRHTKKILKPTAAQSISKRSHEKILRNTERVKVNTNFWTPSQCLTTSGLFCLKLPTTSIRRCRLHWTEGVPTRSHEGKCPKRFRTTDISGTEKGDTVSVPCPWAWRVLLEFRSPPGGHLDAMRSSIHLTTSRSFQTMVRGPRWICLAKVPSAAWA